MALMDDMQGKGITPFAFGDKDGWPAMGTFDILNMRLNGFDFHMSLMAGRRGLGQRRGQAGLRDVDARCCPTTRTTRSAAPGRRPPPRWPRASAACTCSAPSSSTRSRTTVDDLDFFTFPELDASIGADALDAPIDGFCVASGRQEPGRRQGDG